MSGISVSNQDNPFQWKLKTAVDIQCLKEIEDGIKVGMPSVVVANCYYQIVHTVHHTRLENILQKLIVGIGAPRFNFNYNPAIIADSIGVKEFVNTIVQAEQYRHLDFIFGRLTIFNLETDFFQLGGNNAQNLITLHGMSRRFYFFDMSVEALDYPLYGFFHPD